MAEQKKSPTELAHENFDQQRELLKGNGYFEHEAIISVLKANVLSILLALPFILLFSAVFILVWKQADVDMALSFLVLLAVIISIPIHELLHGIGWSLSCKEGFKSVRFGVMWSKLTPYCSCKEPLKLNQYLIGAALPLLVLGILPSLVAVLIGNPYLLSFGALSIICAGGDMLICLEMRKYPGAIFLDHPSECGFFAFTKNAE